MPDDTQAGRAVFRSMAGDGPGWDAAFSRPESVREARSLPEVLEVLAFAEAEAASGRWVVLCLAYEAAQAFDPAMAVCDHGDYPLAYAASYRTPTPCGAQDAAPTPCPGACPGPAYARTPWRPLVGHGRYLAHLDRVRRLLRAGESYQVNYAMPLEAHVDGNAQAMFADLLPGQAAGYAAFLDMGKHKALCFSPELFFKRRGSQVVVRPMKGTMPRGATPAQDAALAKRLVACPKNRAENVMIVDLLRNDLGRIAQAGSVHVNRLFALEAYPTLWQMTSEITAETRPGVSLAELFRALFPCGSVTGAPKVRTMQIIRELEGRARGVYCGALGYVQPGGDAEFCVPIRTVSLHAATGQALYWTGSGVTYDSEPQAEYDECQLKARFLERARPPVRLLETLLLTSGRYALAGLHLRRMRASASALGYAFDVKAAWEALDAGRRGQSGRRRVRLLLDARGSFEVQVQPLAELPAVLRVGLARTPVSSGRELLRHKTEWRTPYDQTRLERPDCDDTLLFNEHGHITETTMANVAVLRGQRLVTPPLADGLLPGVLRERLLWRGEMEEGCVTVEEALAGGGLVLFNSVRGVMRAVLVQAEPRP